MDVGAFSEDNFDAKTWINKAFNQPEAQKNKEQYASALVMKLQLMIAKLNSSLEEQCEQVGAGVLRPKVLRDVESLQQESVLLQGRISDVRNEMEKTNSQNAQESMQTLIEMDKLKQRMQATSKALKEADNWTTLTTEIEDVFDGSTVSSDGERKRSGEIDLVLATTKLNGIQASLKILTHVKDYEDRVLHVEGLKNRLEALASPKLVAAFNTGDTDSARFFVRMFADMERLPQLLKYYRKCIRAKLLKTWAELASTHSIENGNIFQDANQETINSCDDVKSPTLLECADKFFTTVKTVVTDQLPWFDAVFVANFHSENSKESTSSAHDNLIEILLEVYSSLEPKLEECLSVANDQIMTQGDTQNTAGLEQERFAKEKALLIFLTTLKKLFNLHAQDIDKLILPPDENSSSNARLNARLREFARLLYQCFKPSISKYVDMEKSVLAMEIKLSGIQPSKDIVDELRNVSGSVPKLLEILKIAAKRCLELTEGCTYPLLVQSVFPHVVDLYSERYRTLMKRLDKRKSASHSWIILGQSLTLNQACGELLLRLEELDVTLAMEFLNHTKTFLSSSESPDRKTGQQQEKGIDQHDLFLLNNQSSGTGGITSEKLRSFHKGLIQEQEPTSPNRIHSENKVTPIRASVTKLCEDLQATTFSILFHPLAVELSVIANQELTPNMVETVWKDAWAGSDSRQIDMPDFSFAPQEYITHVGQYLMTLPQHLEPYMTNDNPGLTRALQERVFPHCSGVATVTAITDNSTNQEESGSVDFQQNTPADFLLACIAQATCQCYLETILRIPEVSSNSTKQLYTDIGN